MWLGRSSHTSAPPLRLTALTSPPWARAMLLTIARPKLLWRSGCQGSSTGCPRWWRASCRLEGRQVWLVRDARSDSYARVQGLATVSAGPVFVVRARLSKIERGPEGAAHA